MNRNERIKRLEPECSEECPCDKRQVWNSVMDEVNRLDRELTKQYEYIEWLEEFAPKAGEYNTSWDAYELAKGIHYTQEDEEE